MRGLLLLGFVYLAQCAPPEVSLVGLGTVVGSVQMSRANRTIHSFQGIPFAESPTASRRFQAPVARQWNGTLDASQPGSVCLQPSSAHLKRLRRALWDAAGPSRRASKAADPEDCLLVSVYKPEAADISSNLPVMVFVHGGSFIEGSASRFYPDFLLDRDVVLVVPQYRLGPFGFLSLQNEVIPGNAGLLDIVESLRWVQNHIASFGGNPNQVTLFGQSAGAAIATYLMLSPLSRGLVHGVIGNSGSAIASWAIDQEPVRHATEIAVLSGCGQGSALEQGTCLQNVPPGTLMTAFLLHSYEEQKRGGVSLGGSLPVVSRPDEPAATKVVPAHPANVAESGEYPHVPLMMGANRHDAMFVVDLVYNGKLQPNNLTEDEEYMRHSFPQFVVENCGYRDDALVLTDMMEDKYLGHVAEAHRGNFSRLLPGVLDFYSTALMKAPGYRLVQLNSKFADSFWYGFNYQGRFHIPQNGIDPGGLFTEGATHSDEMIYLTPRIEEPFNQKEIVFSKMMVDFWVNFATSWNPSLPNSAPLWPAYDQTGQRYLDINIQSVARSDYPRLEYTAAITDTLKSSGTSVRAVVMTMLVVLSAVLA